MTRYPCSRTEHCNNGECDECSSNPDARFGSTLTLKKDGDRWCALLGKNLQGGNAGFGDTMSEALINLAKEIEI